MDQSVPDTALDVTRQIRTEMSERNRIHAFLPDCAHCFSSDRNRRDKSEQTAAEFFETYFSDGSDLLERLCMRRREMCCVERGGR